VVEHRIGLGELVALALAGDDMQELRAAQLAQIGQRGLKPNSSNIVPGTTMPLACSSKRRASSNMVGTLASTARPTSRALA
jgi:hypothetical protein